MTLMTQEQFDALCEFLDSSDGCNFHETEPGNIESVTWKCDGALSMTRKFLDECIPDVDENLALLADMGGHCDCEVLFNVAERWADKEQYFKTWAAESPEMAKYMRSNFARQFFAAS